MSKIKAVIAPISLRFKAFIIDTFVIFIPILYLTAYIVLGGKDAFLQNQTAIFICNCLFGVILSLFFSISAQTPGYKAQQIYLVNLKTGRKVGFLRAFFRFICFVFSGFSIVGILLCFFRKDRLNLHDLMAGCAPVIKKSD